MEGVAGGWCRMRRRDAEMRAWFVVEEGEGGGLLYQIEKKNEHGPLTSLPCLQLGTVHYDVQTLHELQ